MIKFCRGCQTEKTLEEFAKNRRKKDGLQTRCRGCAARYQAENKETIRLQQKAISARHYQQNKEKILRRSAARYATNTDEIQEQHRQWRRQNLKRANRKQREYNQAHKEYLAEYKRIWHEKNPKKSAEYSAIRRARLRGAFVEHVAFDVVYVREDGICHICTQPVGRSDAEMEHVTPLARGGQHSYANVKIAHSICNRKKAAKDGFQTKY